MTVLALCCTPQVRFFHGSEVRVRSERENALVNVQSKW